MTGNVGDSTEFGPGVGPASEPRSYPQGFFTPAPGAAQILLIRHGQSAPYVTGQPFPLVDGHGDPPLTDLGHFQARLVARRLQIEPITRIYVSTLTRTHQTAVPLARALGLEPDVEPDVREVFLGDAEGGVLREMFANDHPIARRIRKTGEWGSIPNAETNALFTRRTVGAVSRIAERHPGEMVAVFCHGGVIASVLAHAAGTVLRAFAGARHTSVNHLVIQRWPDQDTSNPDAPEAGPPSTNGTGASVTDHDWIIRSFNDASHAGHLTGDHLPGQDFPSTHPLDTISE
ncbi:MAG: histidine phosphatase family protein [Acidimicrobiia bacterium]|nr:histidine phosphatase family protein [Acidimicrobiia bacterium]